jgi:hypothetical protein
MFHWGQGVGKWNNGTTPFLIGRGVPFVPFHSGAILSVFFLDRALIDSTSQTL